MINVNNKAELDNNNLDSTQAKCTGLIVSMVILIVGLFVFAILQVYFKLIINLAEQNKIPMTVQEHQSNYESFITCSALYLVDYVTILLMIASYNSKIKNAKAKSQYHLYLIFWLTFLFPFICSIIWICLYPKALKLSRECPETIFDGNVKMSSNSSHKNISNNIGQSIDQKLAKLDSLKSRGLVDDEDYNRIKNDIINSEIK